MKQVVAVRKDLDMSPGKVAAQVAHASLWAYQSASPPQRDAWEADHERIAVVEINSLKELVLLGEETQEKNVPYAMVTDRGFTEVDEFTNTAIAVGPDEDDSVDEITGHLSLY